MKKVVLVFYVMLCFAGTFSAICAQNQRSPRATTRNITGNWAGISKDNIINQLGEEVPSWLFSLKLKVENDRIKGDYLLSTQNKFDGSLYLFDEEPFDIRGKWYKNKYIVKFRSGWCAEVIAYIKPINSQKIEWRVVSVREGCTLVPRRAILTRRR